jgi:aspartate/methionine/tyrosine aminotransferase
VSAPAYRINPHVAALDAPPIPEAQAWKARYDGRLGPMIDLSQAVPGTPPPARLLEALGRAAADADTACYGPILGDAALRAAHAAEATRLYGGAIGPEHVAITSGCNQAFVVAMLALAEAGDEVILPAPWYFNHSMTLDMLGLKTVALAADPAAGFVPDPNAARRLITPRTRAIVLVSPNNPTGALYPPAVIAAFAQLAREAGIALVLDETYRDFWPADLPRGHALFESADWGETLIQLYSFSKAYAIPGHRLGAIVAAPATIQEIAKIQDSLQICPPRAAQAVIAEAIEAERPWRAAQAAELAARAAACRAAFAATPAWRLDAVGAYFAYVAHPFPHRPAAEIAERLCIEAGVLALPGSYFGPAQSTHLRFAFANVGADVLAGLAERLRMVG